MNVTLVASPLANLASIQGALRHVGGEVTVSADPADIRRSDRIVVPGVGSYDRAMSWLDDTAVGAAIAGAVSDGAALLGICLGHQLLFEQSDEGGDTRGLALLKGCVRRLDASAAVPHIGWSAVSSSEDVLFDGIAGGEYFYFVHSYAAVGVDPGEVVATCDYGVAFVAAARRGRVCGVQFHPEKSSGAGLKLLRNFMELV